MLYEWLWSPTPEIDPEGVPADALLVLPDGVPAESLDIEPEGVPRSNL
jgi:hypothetical protein